MNRTWGAGIQKIVAASQAWKCKACNCMLPASYQLDHVVPLWKGGLDEWDSNAQALCPTCHANKTQKEEVERRGTCKQRQTHAVFKARRMLHLDKIVSAHENPFIAYTYIPRPKCGPGKK